MSFEVTSPDGTSPEDMSESPEIVLPTRPEELLEWALDRWRRKVAIFTAFQAEGMVLLDMAHRIDPGVRVVTLDTGRLPEETYELIERVRDRYDIAVKVVTPDAGEVSAMVDRGGPNLFYRSVSDRRACCRVRKVEPLRRALAGFEAWITGQRRSQAASRAGIGRIEVDQDHGGICKLNPLADWSWREVWDYVRSHDVPYHRLYDRGYTSIGCAPCTRAVGPWEGHRAGRWWWEEPTAHKECGLHFSPSGSLESSGRAATGRAATGRAATGRAATGRAATGRAATGRSLPVLDDSSARGMAVTV